MKLMFLAFCMVAFVVAVGTLASGASGAASDLLLDWWRYGYSSIPHWLVDLFF